MSPCLQNHRSKLNLRIRFKYFAYAFCNFQSKSSFVNSKELIISNTGQLENSLQARSNLRGILKSIGNPLEN